MFFSLCPKPATLRSTVAVVVWTLRNPGIYTMNFAQKNNMNLYFLDYLFTVLKQNKY